MTDLQGYQIFSPTIKKFKLRQVEQSPRLTPFPILIYRGALATTSGGGGPASFFRHIQFCFLTIMRCLLLFLTNIH